jgi:hypothetical protein
LNTAPNAFLELTQSPPGHEANDIQDVIFEHSVNCPKPAPQPGDGGGNQPRTQRG